MGKENSYDDDHGNFVCVHMDKYYLFVGDS